jgi:fucose 4-O-acetylase-like acetyltransferase
MTENPPKQRSATIDCLKGLAIFLVVWGHCIQFLFNDVIPVVRVLRHSAVAPLMTYLGRYTLEIYVLSAPILPWMHYLRIPHANALFYTCVTTPLVLVVQCFLFICIAKAIRRSRTLSLLLLGA